MAVEQFVHLAPPEAIAAHIADPDREKGRPSALAEEGFWHRVASFLDKPGTWDRDEARQFTTTCGLVQDERPDRMDEVTGDPPAVPGGALCAACFPKGK
jgi:hypothetical protein